MQEDRRQNESIEGTPKSDGNVSDEDMNVITDNPTQGGVEGGQDSSTSTEGREEQQPTEGVGAQPDENDRQANTAKTSN